MLIQRLILGLVKIYNFNSNRENYTQHLRNVKTEQYNLSKKNDVKGLTKTILLKAKQ